MNLHNYDDDYDDDPSSYEALDHWGESHQDSDEVEYNQEFVDDKEWSCFILRTDHIAVADLGRKALVVFGAIDIILQVLPHKIYWTPHHCSCLSRIGSGYLRIVEDSFKGFWFPPKRRLARGPPNTPPCWTPKERSICQLERLLNIFRTQSLRCVLENWGNRTGCEWWLLRKKKATVELIQDSMTETCAICLVDVKKGFITICGHHFHESCLGRWMHKKRACPMCWTPLDVGIQEALPYQ